MITHSSNQVLTISKGGAPRVLQSALYWPPHSTNPLDSRGRHQGAAPPAATGTDSDSVMRLDKKVIQWPMGFLDKSR